MQIKKTAILIILAFLFTGISVQAQKVIHINEKTFKEKIYNYENDKTWNYKGDVPAIVDFYADWCGPCRRVAPTLEELAKKYGKKIIIYKVNTDHNKNVSSAFGIRSIPAFLFIPTKGKPSMATGALPKSTFERAIKEVLKVK